MHDAAEPQNNPSATANGIARVSRAAGTPVSGVRHAGPGVGQALGRMALPLLLATALTSCTVGPDFVEPAAPPVSGYLPGKLGSTASTAGPGGTSQRFDPGADVSGTWWRLFKSKQINDLVEEAIANHPDLAAAQAALRQARELAAADSGAFFPSISGSEGINRQRVNPAAQGQPGKGYEFALYNTSVAVSFVPDIWGKTQRTVEADTAAAEMQRFQLEATYMTLTANVVTTAINDASYASQIQVTREIISSEQKLVDLLDQQFKLGAVSEADVLSQKAQLAASLATLPPLEKARGINRDLLMAYLGRFPSQDKGEAVSLSGLHLPRDLPLSVPSVLVRQRPDIRAAEATVHQTGALVGVATANMLPQITLSATGGGQAGSFAKLFQASNGIWSVGAGVAEPIFDAGSLFHTKEARVAAFDQAKEKYKSTVITAFQNVADSLKAIRADAMLLQAQETSERTAAASLKISEEQFKAGSGTYLNVLNAQQTLLNARTSRVKAEAARFADTVALYQSLGGGWWNRADVTAAADVRDPGIAVVSEPLGALANGVKSAK